MAKEITSTAESNLLALCAKYLREAQDGLRDERAEVVAHALGELIGLRETIACLCVGDPVANEVYKYAGRVIGQIRKVYHE